MSANDRAMMLGIRHRCGQEINFWIPSYLIAPIIGDLHEHEVEGLAGWMQDQGMLPAGDVVPDDLVEHLRDQLAPRSVAFVDVEKDPSICPACGTIIPWIDAVSEYVAGKPGGEL